MPDQNFQDRRFEPGHPFVPLTGPAPGDLVCSGADLREALGRALQNPASFGLSKILDLVKYAQREVDRRASGSVTFDSAFVEGRPGSAAGLTPLYLLTVQRSCQDPAVLTSVSLSLEHFKIPTGANITKETLRARAKNDAYPESDGVIIGTGKLVLPAGSKVSVELSALKGQQLKFALLHFHGSNPLSHVHLLLGRSMLGMVKDARIIQRFFQWPNLWAGVKSALGLSWSTEISATSENVGKTNSEGVALRMERRSKFLGLSHQAVVISNSGTVGIALKFAKLRA